MSGSIFDADLGPNLLYTFDGL